MKLFPLKLSLLTRFSILSFVLLVGIGIALAWIIQQRLEKNELRFVAADAANQASSIIEPILSGTELTHPFDSEHYAKLDAVVRKHILIHTRILRVNILSPNGVVVYSDSKEIVGHRFPLSESLKLALRGETATEVSSLERGESINKRVHFGQVLEAYVPIKPTGSTEIIGVWKIYYDLEAPNPRIDKMRLVIGTGIGLGFFILYISLFTLVRSASRELVYRNEENKRLYKDTKQQLTELERTGEELQRNLRMQTALSALLNISLLNIPLEEQLGKILGHIIAIPWIAFESKGCVFLVENDPKVLVMKTHQGMSKSLLAICERVPFGQCLCGRAALSGEIEFAECVDNRHDIMHEGISDHGHYCVPFKSHEKVLGVLNLNLKEGHSRDESEERFVYAVADVLAGIVERSRSENNLVQTLEKLRKTLGGIVEAIAQMVETRDPYTAGHQRRSADLARAIANEMGLSQEQVDGIRIAGLIHDLGKMYVPSEILSKPGRITDLEYSLIKTHPQAGYDILKNIGFPWPIAQIVLQHHERIDGSGYPFGLLGKDILIEAKVLAVGDVVEAIASHRPYRPSYGIDKAFEEISKNKGILYDSQIVDACLRLFNEKGYQLRPE